MSDLNPEDIKRLAEELNNLVSGGINPMGTASQKVTGNLGDFADAVKKLESLKDLTKTVVKATDSLSDFVKSVGDAIEEQEKGDKAAAKTKLDAAKQFGKGLLSAGESYMGAMNDATQGTGKYAKSVEQLGVSARQLGDAFGVAGGVIGYSAEKLMQWAAASLKQNDSLNKAYENLSKFGQVDTSDLNRLMHDFHDMGLSVQNAQIYIDAVSKASNELALFGSTAAKGREQFQKSFDGTLNNAEVQDKLFRLGYSTQEIVEQSANYMAGLAMSARSQKNDTALLHKQTLDYLETYAELTALTGKNRDDMAKSRRAQEEDLGFQLHLEQLRASGRGAEAEQQSAMATMMGVYGKEYQTGYQQYARSGGSFAGPEAARLIPAFGMDALKGAHGAASARYGSREEAMNAMVDAMSRTGKGFERATQVYGGNLRFSRTGNMPGVGLTAEAYKAAQLFSGRGSKDLEEFRKSILAKPEESDRRGLLSRQMTAERKFQQMTDEATYKMGDLTVPAVTNLAEAATYAADAITGMTDAIGLTDNWNRSMKTFDKLTDIADELSKQQKKQAELTKQINDANEELAESDQKIEYWKEEAKKGGIRGWWAEGQIKKYQEQRTTASENKARAEQQYQRSEQESSRAVRAGTRIQQAGGDVLAGLPVYSKSGDAHKPGEYVHPDLIEKMHRMVAEVPGFDHFTSVNDRFHQNRISEHNKGRAVDLVLNKPNPTNEDLDKAIRALEGMGLKVLDEYRKPSSGATAPHLHAALQARSGGIFSGPSTGYKVELHGKEAVVPLSSSQKFGKNYSTESQVTKHSLNNPGSAVSSLATTVGGVSQTDAMLRQLMNVLIGRFDDMIAELQQSNSTQNKIAKKTKK